MSSRLHGSRGEGFALQANHVSWSASDRKKQKEKAPHGPWGGKVSAQRSLWTKQGPCQGSVEEFPIVFQGWTHFIFKSEKYFEIVMHS